MHAHTNSSKDAPEERSVESTENTVWNVLNPQIHGVPSLTRNTIEELYAADYTQNLQTIIHTIGVLTDNCGFLFIHLVSHYLNFYSAAIFFISSIGMQTYLNQIRFLDPYTLTENDNTVEQESEQSTEIQEMLTYRGKATSISPLITVLYKTFHIIQSMFMTGLFIMIIGVRVFSVVSARLRETSSYEWSSTMVLQPILIAFFAILSLFIFKKETKATFTTYSIYTGYLCAFFLLVPICSYYLLSIDPCWGTQVEKMSSSISAWQLSLDDFWMGAGIAIFSMPAWHTTNNFIVKKGKHVINRARARTRFAATCAVLLAHSFIAMAVHLPVSAFIRSRPSCDIFTGLVEALLERLANPEFSAHKGGLKTLLLFVNLFELGLIYVLASAALSHINTIFALVSPRALPILQVALQKRFVPDRLKKMNTVTILKALVVLFVASISAVIIANCLMNKMVYVLIDSGWLCSSVLLFVIPLLIGCMFFKESRLVRMSKKYICRQLGGISMVYVAVLCFHWAITKIVLWKALHKQNFTSQDSLINSCLGNTTVHTQLASPIN